MGLFNRRRKKKGATATVSVRGGSKGSTMNIGRGGGGAPSNRKQSISKNKNEVTEFLVAGGSGVKNYEEKGKQIYESNGKRIVVGEGENIRKLKTGKGTEYKKLTEGEVKEKNKTPLHIERQNKVQLEGEEAAREIRGEPSIEEMKNFDKAKNNVVGDTKFNPEAISELERDAETLLGSERLYEIAADPKTSIALGFGILTLVTLGGFALAGGGAAAATAATGGRAVITRTAYQGAKSVFTQRAFTGAASRAGVNKLFSMSGRAAVTKGLQKAGVAGTKKLLLKRGVQIGAAVVSADILMSWLASDNIISGSAIYARDVGNLVEEGAMTAEEGLTYLDEIEGLQNLARGKVQVSGKYNPLMRPYAKQLMANAELGNKAIELQKNKIQQYYNGGVQ
jgi:hypothetical protein